MSSRFASEQLASLRLDAPRPVEQAEDEEDHALALPAVEDMNVASRSPARLLITAATPHAVETLARRIHGSGARAQFPERLFYRLNIIHVVAGAGPPEVTLTQEVMEMHLKDVSSATCPL